MPSSKQIPNSTNDMIYIAGRAGSNSISSITGELDVSNSKTRSIWTDVDKNGKYDIRKDVNLLTHKTITTHLNEAENDVRKINKKYIAEFMQKTNAYKHTHLVKKEAQKVELNGKIEKSSQGHTGDCWALAGINALAHNKAGAKLIKEMISYDNKGNATVTLKGTGGVYKFSKQEINRAEGRLSRGDDDVRVLEMALEKHLAKLPKRVQSNETATRPNTGTNILKSAPLSPLTGGTGAKSFALLTKNKIFRCENLTPSQGIWNQIKNFCNQKKLDHSLSLVQNNPQKYVATTSFRTKLNSKLITHHAYSVISADKKYVVLSNPWDSSKLIKMDRGEFLKNCLRIDLCDMTQKY